MSPAVAKHVDAFGDKFGGGEGRGGGGGGGEIHIDSRMTLINGNGKWGI